VRHASSSPVGALLVIAADPPVPHTAAVVGVEFKSPTDRYTPAQNKVPAKMASKVQNKCLEKDLLVLTTSVYETIRFVSSLCV